MHREEAPWDFTDEQMQQWERHVASKGINLQCPFCGHPYFRPLFVSVPVVARDQQTPVTITRPLVQVECRNCAHVAQFNVPLTPGDMTAFGMADS